MSTMNAAADWRSDMRILSVIGTGHGMSHFYYMVLPPIFLHLREAYTVSFVELGAMLAVMSAASAVVQVPIGFMVDRLGARFVLLAGLATVSIATGMMGFTSSFWQLVALSFISGIGNAVFHPTDYAILNSSISPGRMGRAFSIHTFTGHIGTASAPVAMIALTSYLGWRSALMVAGLMGLVALLVLVSQLTSMRDDLGPKAKPATDRSSAAAPAKASVLAAVFNKQMLIFFLFFIVLSMMQTGLSSFAVAALVALHDTPLTTASLALSVYLFASAAGVLLGGEISDRTTRHDLVAAAVFIVSALFCLLFATVNLPAAVLVTLMAIMGLGQGATRPARDMMLRAATPKGSTGGVFGFVTSGIAVGSALAPIPIGYLLDIGRPGWVFYLLAAFMVLALFTVLTPQTVVTQPGTAKS